MVYQSRNISQVYLVFRIAVHIAVLLTTELRVIKIDVVDQSRNIRQIPLSFRITTTVVELDWNQSDRTRLPYPTTVYYASTKKDSHPPWVAVCYVHFSTAYLGGGGPLKYRNLIMNVMSTRFTSPSASTSATS